MQWLTSKLTVQSGITFGAALAIVISYSRSNSILLAALHGVMSWGYVIYAAMSQQRYV